MRKLRHRDLALKPSTVTYTLPCLKPVCPALLVVCPPGCLVLVITSSKFSPGVILRAK